MRKLFLVTLAASVLAASAVPAIAVEPKFSGNYRIRGESFNETTAGTPSTSDNVSTLWDTRLRLQMELIASENLKAVYQLEIGDISLGAETQPSYPGMGQGASAAMGSLLNDGQGRFTGGTNAGGQAGNDAMNVETKHMYLDVTFPNSTINLKAGLMPLKLGHGVILDNDFSAFILSAKTDPATFSFFTFQPTSAGTNVEQDNDFDFYGLSADSELGGNGSIGAYLVYARAHDTANGGGVADTAAAAYGFSAAQIAANPYSKYDAYWLGLSTDLVFDMITVALEADYHLAQLSKAQGGPNLRDAENQSYFLYADVAANLEKHKIGIAAFYASGNPDDGLATGEVRSERFMPIMPANREDGVVLNWDNMFLQDGINQYGANVISNLVSIKAYAECTASEDLSGGISVQGYWKAQNPDTGNGVLAAGASGNKGRDDFYGTEFDLDIAYKIYEHLTYNINAAYMITDDQALGGANVTNDNAGGSPGTTSPTFLAGQSGVEDIWFVGHSLVYNF